MKLELLVVRGFFLVAFLLASTAGADDTDVEFMVQEKCTSCHGPELYIRDDRRVHSLKELGTMVRACNTNTGAQWFDDETDMVIDYLNKAYYKFGAE